MNMTQPSILITGAANGIGLATAHHFSRRDWFVCMLDIKEQQLAQAVQTVEKDKHPNSTIYHSTINVSDQSAWQKLISELASKTDNKLNVLFNNAGILRSGPFEETPFNEHELLIQVNVQGVLNACHAAFPLLKNTQDASVINMASASAIYGQPSLATYSASKFAVRGLTEALDLEWETHGIRVMSLWPTFVATQMVQNMAAKSIQSLGIKLTAEDVAQMVWKLAHYRGRRKVHWPVGWQSHLFMRSAKLTPDWLSRWMNARVST